MEVRTRALSLADFNLPTWNEGWNREELGCLSLTTDDSATFDTGTATISLRDSLHGSVCQGKSWVERQPFGPGRLTCSGRVVLSAAFLWAADDLMRFDLALECLQRQQRT